MMAMVPGKKKREKKAAGKVEKVYHNKRKMIMRCVVKNAKQVARRKIERLRYLIHLSSAPRLGTLTVLFYFYLLFI